MNIFRTKDSKHYLVYLLVVFAGLIVGQQFFHLSGQTLLGRALNNSLHTPWFFTVTVLIWCFQTFLIHKFLPTLKVNFSLALLSCGSFSLMLAVGTEALQILSSRDASFSDVGRDMLGTAAALCLISTKFPWPRFRTFYISLCIIGAFGLLSLGFTELGKTWIGVNNRNAMAPLLIGFDQESNEIIGPMNRTRSELTIISADQNWPEFFDQQVAKLTLTDQLGRSGLNLTELYSDWSSYEWLVLKTYVEGAEPLAFTVKVKTFATGEGASRVEGVMAPGKNVIKIAIDDLILDRENKMSGVHGLRILSKRGYGGRVLYFGEISLE